MFHSRRELPAVTSSWKKVLQERCRELWDGVDLAVNVTDDGGRGLIFKGDQYYRYTLDRLVFGPREKLSAITGPYSISKDFPGLWPTNVTAAFAGAADRIYVFQKYGTFDANYEYLPPQYMIYDLAAKKIESGYPRSIADDWPGLLVDDVIVPSADRSMAAALLQRTNSLLGNLLLETDYFGNLSTFTVLGTPEYFDSAKKEALGYLKSAEDEYRRYQKAMNESAEKKAGANLTVSVESDRYDAIERERSKVLTRANDAFAEVDRLRSLLDANRA